MNKGIQNHWQFDTYEEHLYYAKAWFKFIKKGRCPKCKTKKKQIMISYKKLSGSPGSAVTSKRCTNCNYGYIY